MYDLKGSKKANFRGFSRTWRVRGQGLDSRGQRLQKLSPRGRPRGQGRPLGRHLCK